MDLDRGILILFVGILLVISAMLVLPYAQFVVVAAILGYTLQPLHSRLTNRVRPTVSALLLLTASVLAVVVPLVLVFALVAGDALSLVQDLQETQINLGVLEADIERLTGQSVDLQSMLQEAARNVVNALFGNAIDALQTATHMVIGGGLFLFLLFYFVRDGHRFTTWLRQVTPMPRRVVDDLIEHVEAVTRAVLAGHVLVAIIQGVIAGVGLAILGVPNAAFWTFVMIVLALIPIIGTFVVWAPASLYLLAVGRPAAALFLFVYGTIVVGVSDEYLRPVVVDRYAKINPSIVLVGVLGGISMYGFVGLFVGPIVVGALKASIEVYSEHYGHQTVAGQDLEKEETKG